MKLTKMTDPSGKYATAILKFKAMSPSYESPHIEMVTLTLGEDGADLLHHITGERDRGFSMDIATVRKLNETLNEWLALLDAPQDEQVA